MGRIGTDVWWKTFYQIAMENPLNFNFMYTSPGMKLPTFHLLFITILATANSSVTLYYLPGL